MPVIESRLINALLRFGRTRTTSRRPEEPVATNAGEAPIRRREAHFSDFAAVEALKTRSGLSPDSIENWGRLWRGNPALAYVKSDTSMGWVLETDGQIVGYMGSIPQLYQFGGQTLLAAVTTCYAVDSAYRASSLGIVGAFFQQRGYDLYLNTTATEAAGKVVRAFRAVPLPQKDYDQVLFWVLRPHRFLQAVTKKLELVRAVAVSGAWLGSSLLSADILFRRRRPGRGRPTLSCRQLRVEEIGDDFQGLWLRKTKERPRLFAVRTPETLRWHFTVPHSSRKVSVLSCYQGDRLVGYAIILSAGPDRLGLCKSAVADLLVERDRPEVISELMMGAHEIAKQNESDVLEILGFPAEIRQLCLSWRPYSRKYPACPFFYKAKGTELTGLLSNQDAWYAGPFDGDTTLAA